MKKRSRKQVPANNQIEISFVKQNKQLTMQQNRLNVEILRVHTIQKQRIVIQLFQMQQQELCQFFSKYQLFPYNTQFDIAQLLESNKLKLIKNQDKIYFGQVQRKRREGKGINITKDGKIYEGSFFNNQKNGAGVEIYPNGNLYLGQFQNGKKHGNGQFFWFNLSSKNPKQDEYVEYYEGEWWGGLPDGEGIHQKINGDFYTGNFKNGLKHGQGCQYFGNGDVYKGEYVNGLPQGYGQYTWSDKSYYKGDFKQGLRNGYGVWGYGGQSTEKYKGHYCMDKKSGYGVYEWQNGWIYKGNFDNDFRNGFGQLYDQSKLVYRGYWENGQQTQKQVVKPKEIFAKSSNFLNKNSSQIYNRTIGSASKTHRNPIVKNNWHREQNPQKPNNYNRTKNKSSSKFKKNPDQDWYEDFGKVHHQEQFIVKNRPQSFNFSNSGNKRRQAMTERKLSRHNHINGGKNNGIKNNIMSTIGSSISRPLNRNFGTLYVPYPANNRYSSRNYC